VWPLIGWKDGINLVNQWHDEIVIMAKRHLWLISWLNQSCPGIPLSNLPASDQRSKFNLGSESRASPVYYWDEEAHESQKRPFLRLPST
jgi:hypothetical protein